MSYYDEIEMIQTYNAMLIERWRNKILMIRFETKTWLMENQVKLCSSGDTTAVILIKTTPDLTTITLKELLLDRKPINYQSDDSRLCVTATFGSFWIYGIYGFIVLFKSKTQHPHLIRENRQNIWKRNNLRVSKRWQLSLLGELFL